MLCKSLRWYAGLRWVTLCNAMTCRGCSPPGHMQAACVATLPLGRSAPFAIRHLLMSGCSAAVAATAVAHVPGDHQHGADVRRWARVRRQQHGRRRMVPQGQYSVQYSRFCLFIFVVLRPVQRTVQRTAQSLFLFCFRGCEASTAYIQCSRFCFFVFVVVNACDFSKYKAGETKRGFFISELVCTYDAHPWGVRVGDQTNAN